MRQIQALLRDRKRAQRGSVLSGVLILVALIAILAGALMTELSTSFLASRVLVDTVANQATVSSVMEAELDRLQNTQLFQPCPLVAPLTLNSRTAVATSLSCAPVVDRRTSPQYNQVAASNQFNVDGTQQLGQYLVGDSGGTIFNYSFGRSASRWSIPLGGATTGPPMVMRDPSHQGQFLDVIPLTGPACPGAGSCVYVVSDDNSSSQPARQCTSSTGGAVASRPASGVFFTYVAFYGDATGTVSALDFSSGASGQCDVESTSRAQGAAAGLPVVAGPVLFPCRSSCGGHTTDELYVVVSDNNSSFLVHYLYRSSTLTYVSSLQLPWAGAKGIAVESNQLPARLAITFASGGVALVQISSNNAANLANQAQPATGISSAPFWCQCPGGSNMIGVGGQSGLYVLDASQNSLATVATYAPGGSIRTSPGADAAGDWYFGADDGNLYEVQQQTGQAAMTLIREYGASAMGQIGSSVQVGACPAGICAYLGSATSNRAYLVSLDARAAVITACISVSPPTCQAQANPRLWASVEVGVVGNPQTVHVEGWSYFSA